MHNNAEKNTHPHTVIVFGERNKFAKHQGCKFLLPGQSWPRILSRNPAIRCVSFSSCPGPRVWPKGGGKTLGRCLKGGCGSGLRPTMEQRRAPWSHWPNFRPRNTTLLMCEKRGAWMCVRGNPPRHRPQDLVWIMSVSLFSSVQFTVSVFRFGSSCCTECAHHKYFYNPLTYHNSP